MSYHVKNIFPDLYDEDTKVDQKEIGRIIQILETMEGREKILMFLNFRSYLRGEVSLFQLNLLTDLTSHLLSTWAFLEESHEREMDFCSQHADIPF